MSPSSSRGALSALFVTILIWAYSWVVMKQVLAYAGPFHFAALRYLLGAAVLFAALLLTRQSLQPPPLLRSEEHTSELQSLMRISYAVFCLKKKKQKNTI